METTQDYANNEVSTTDKKDSVELINGLTPVQDEYIALVALGGLIPDPSGEKPAIKMTASDFAQRNGISRDLLYYWRKSIPDFWDRVNKKRKEISGKDRLSNVWNGLYLKAVAGNERAAAIYLANHDPDFKMPMQQVKHEAGNSWIELIQRNKNRTDAIEGEVIDNGTSAN